MYVLFLAVCAAGLWLYGGEELRSSKASATVKIKLKEAGDRLEMTAAARRSRAAEEELYKSCVLLKNVVIATQQTRLSADSIYERLMDGSRGLKSMYGRMLSLYRSGRDEEAFRVPAEVIGTREARNFGLILSKLGKIDPVELREQMDIFMKGLTDRRVTSAMKQAQRNSVIITALASVSVFALLVNFTVVVVFMSSVELMSSVFA